MHPDVKKGIKTEEEVLSEFLDTFEVHHHHALKHPEVRDGKVTLREFIEYYNNISSRIDSYEYFELLITNASNLNDVNSAKPRVVKFDLSPILFVFLKFFFPIRPFAFNTFF